MPGHPGGEYGARGVMFFRHFRHSNPQKDRKVFLVGGLEHFLNFHFIYGMSSFPLTFIFFRGVGQPPTSFQMNFRISRFSNCHIVGSNGSTVDVSLWEFVTGKTEGGTNGMELIISLRWRLECSYMSSCGC